MMLGSNLDCPLPPGVVQHRLQRRATTELRPSTSQAPLQRSEPPFKTQFILAGMTSQPHNRLAFVINSEQGPHTLVREIKRNNQAGQHQKTACPNDAPARLFGDLQPSEMAHSHRIKPDVVGHCLRSVKSRTLLKNPGLPLSAVALCQLELKRGIIGFVGVRMDLIAMHDKIGNELKRTQREAISLHLQTLAGTKAYLQRRAAWLIPGVECEREFTRVTT